MTSVTGPGGPGPDDGSGELFIADFYPRLGAYLARQHESGYDAVANRARYLLWLASHVDDRDALAEFSARAGRIPRLTAEEETGLATQVQAGRRAEERLAEGGGPSDGALRAQLERLAYDGVLAGDRLRETSLRLVVSLAERYTGRGVPVQELIRAGDRGLIRAVQKYDPARGYQFASYATWWIRQAISRAIADQEPTVQVPVPMAETLSQPARPPGNPAAEPEAAGTDELTATERRMLEALGRQPTPEELAAELELSPP